MNDCTSIVRVFSGCTEASSSSVSTTCLPFSSSNPRPTSSHWTSASSCEQKRCCSIGALSFLCSWRKWRSRSRVAPVSCTGTLTSPKESDPFQSGRGMSGLPALQARLQGGGEVVRLLALLELDPLDLLALGLAVDQVEDSLAVGVLVVGRVELLVQRVHELLGHLGLLLARAFARDRHLEVA